MPSSRGILYPSKEGFGISISEFACSTVPIQCSRQIALYPPNMRASKEGGVERTAKPQCCSTIPRCGCVFIKKPGGGQVTGGEKCVASRQQSISLRFRKALVSRRGLVDKRRWSGCGRVVGRRQNQLGRPC